MELIILLVLSLIPMDPSSHEYFTSEIGTSDGGTIITGSLHRSEGIVIKLASNQSHEWTTFIPNAGEVSSIAEAPDGYIVVGFWPFVSIHKNPRGFGWIARLNDTGHMKWKHDFEKGNYSEFHKVIQILDGNFVTVGLVGTGESEDGFIVKFTPKGKIIWYRTCCDNSTEVFENIVETGTNEFMIFGKSDDRPIIVTLVEKNDEIEMVNLFLGI